MRIPYIDGQTGVAQKHYDNERSQRERMPGRSGGQVYTYPQVSHKPLQEQDIIAEFTLTLLVFMKTLLLVTDFFFHFTTYAASVAKEAVPVLAVLHAAAAPALRARCGGVARGGRGLRDRGQQ